MITDGLPEVLTAAEAAKVLRMSARGLTHLLRSGRMRAVKVGRRWLIPKDEVIRVLTEGTVGYFVHAPPADGVPLAGGRVRPGRVNDDDQEEDRPKVSPDQLGLGLRGSRRGSVGDPVDPRMRIIE